MTAKKIESVLEQLSAPFPQEEVQTRPGKGKEQLHYLEIQSYENRLDSVLGIGGWQNNYQFGPNGEIVCNLGILVDGNWVWRADGAGQTQFEAIKGGLTDAFKRACRRFGIGRYLSEGMDDGLHKPGWTEAQILAVTDNCHIDTPENAKAFLKMAKMQGGTSPEFVGEFARLYQEHFEASGNKKDALNQTIKDYRGK